MNISCQNAPFGNSSSVTYRQENQAPHRPSIQSRTQLLPYSALWYVVGQCKTKQSRTVSISYYLFQAHFGISAEQKRENPPKKRELACRINCVVCVVWKAEFMTGAIYQVPNLFIQMWYTHENNSMQSHTFNHVTLTDRKSFLSLQVSSLAAIVKSLNFHPGVQRSVGKILTPIRSVWGAKESMMPMPIITLLQINYPCIG